MTMILDFFDNDRADGITRPKRANHPDVATYHPVLTLMERRDGACWAGVAIFGKGDRGDVFVGIFAHDRTQNQINHVDVSLM